MKSKWSCAFSGKNVAILLASLALLPPLAVPVEAHHSRAPYLLDTTVELPGVVKRVSWRNPHVYVDLEVINSEGEAEVWVLEGHSTGGMTGFGWQSDSVKEGDNVIAVVNPNRNPANNNALIDHFNYSDGRAFYAFQQPPEASATASAAAPRPVILPSRDFSGNWMYMRPRADVLVFQSPNFDSMPLTEAGKAATADFSFDDSPSLRCESTGLPRQITLPYDTVWTREEDRILVEKDQYAQDGIRTIYLDGRNMPEDFEPGPLGFSVGRFEEDGSLVIETSGFSPTEAGLQRGVPSSSEKRLTERYQLLNNGMRMLIEYRVEDPVYLTEAMEFIGVLDKRLDRALNQTACDIEAATRHLEFED